ncbi:MAG: hypothetical protein ACXAC7_05625 [Candidatus Hodarchaeales archaeon]|jgi:ABC-type spermidine/putrescine transport system permease subunit II
MLNAKINKKKSSFPKRKVSGKWIWHYLDDNQVWMAVSIFSVLYSFTLVVPFMQMFNRGEFDLGTSLAGFLFLFVIGPIIIAASPRFYLLIKGQPEEGKKPHS